ncbi:AAA family ATPase [Pseudomonas cerasi]|uniref:SMC domain-containing protein n=1 Tax=Pseudomonas cerasi TaxID=1583341 RepID=A0A193SS63_9PSED|nr:AAA family ATPase [Pseudomonas cerasi]CZT29870.1 SMC domain-containing protein [Pseudomonas cerasi]SOS21591.1 SMC domain-containing protein [Pseudomonas cerasi]
MKIESIYIENFQGLSNANLELTAPITMVCGHNGAGKSSLKEAIGLALGEAARVAKKGDYKMLITEGQKKGQIIIGHDGAASTITLPTGKGERTDVDGQEYLPFVLNPDAFAKLDDKAKRSLLFALTKSSAKPAVVAEKLLAKGADPKKVEAIKPLLLSGFAAAQEQAKSNTSESRGAWKAITGEAYGTEKAECWAVFIDELPEGVPEVTPADLEAAQAEQGKAAIEIDKGNQYLGELKANLNASANWAARKTDLEEKAKLLDRERAKLIATEESLAEWQPKLKQWQDAVQAYNGESPCECPSCHVKLKVVGQQVEVFKGKTADAKKLTEAQAEVKKAAEAVRLLESTRNNDRLRIDAALAAQRDLAAHIESTPQSSSEADITRCESAIQVQRDIRTRAEAKATMVRDRLNTIANAGKIAADAAKHHKDVLDWILIEKALAPDGIPGEILAGALQPINNSLKRLCTLAGWPVTAIGGDMAITAGGRAYVLLSESERWRCDALIGTAITIACGLKLIVLDRFDVLLPAVRGQLFGMLVALARSGDIETAIVCGSLKEKPPKMRDEIDTVWIEGGIAGGDVQLQQAS